MCMLHDSRLRAIDLNLLVILAALLTERHVTRAARRVGLSQSATSHALGRLRELYGDPLLVRSGKRLDLTPRALALLPQLERGLDELAGTVVGEPGFDPRGAQRSFTLGMADYVQAIMLEPLLRTLECEAPGIALSANAFPNAVELLDEGRLDLALTVPGNLPAGFSSQKVFSDGFMCVVRDRHPTVRGKRITLEQYLALSHLVVSPAGAPGSMVDSALAKRGRSRRIALTVTSFLVAPVIVASTDLISTGPQRLLRRMIKPFKLRALPTPVDLSPFEIHTVWHSRRAHDPAHVWLREVVTRVARQL